MNKRLVFALYGLFIGALIGTLLVLGELTWVHSNLMVIIPATIVLCIILGVITGYNLGHPNRRRSRPRSRRHSSRRRRRSSRHSDSEETTTTERSRRNSD
jgi:UDP-N-acetylmuramyl pentapeptide phosphotransferase/UDP-N-acetylglucosamine-1-phosphate transferase